MVSILLLFKVNYLVPEEGKVIEAQVVRLQSWRLESLHLINCVHTILDLHQSVVGHVLN